MAVCLLLGARSCNARAARADFHNGADSTPARRFAHAARILVRDRAANSRRLVAIGASYSGGAAPLIAATFPRLFHGAIGLVPDLSISAGRVERQSRL